MKITLTNIKWRSKKDSDVFNLQDIQSIEFDEEIKIVTIVCAAGTYKSPYCNLNCGSYKLYEFTCKRPHSASLEYINIVVFQYKGAVAVYRGLKHYGDWFYYRCQTYCE